MMDDLLKTSSLSRRMFQKGWKSLSGYVVELSGLSEQDSCQRGAETR